MEDYEFINLIKTQYCLRDQECHFLIEYLLDSWKSYKEMENEVLPYLESLMNGTGKVDDWKHFEWHGTVCLRTDHIVIVDEIHSKPGGLSHALVDKNGNLILNENCEWLLDTASIEKHHLPSLKIQIMDFYTICQKWAEFCRENFWR